MANSSGFCLTVDEDRTPGFSRIGGADFAKDGLAGVADPAFLTPILGPLIEIDAAVF